MTACTQITQITPLTPTGGVVPHQLVQCDAQDRAVLDFSGTCDAAVQGALEARVVAQIAYGAVQANQKILGWAPCGKAGAGAWSVQIKEVPVGGPYRVEIRREGESGACCAIEPVLVGDLWILAGQSNMEGVGNMIDVPQPSPRVSVFAMNDTWRIAEEPLHRRAEACDQVQNAGIVDDAARHGLVANVEGAVKGVCPGLPFALEVMKRTGRPIGLVPCAQGGTSMDQWSPDLKDQGERSLYGAMVRRFQAVGGRVRGMLWYQGESDTWPPELSAAFPAKFQKFVESVRRDFNDPNLPFYYVQIGCVSNDWPEPTWNIIQAEQLACERTIPNVGMVAAVDVELNDLIHIGTEGQKTLGRRLAHLALRGVYGQTQLQIGPRPVETKQVETPYGHQLRVRFEGVNGRLVAPEGRVSGFSLARPDGTVYKAIFHQEIDPKAPDTVILWIFYDPAQTSQAIPPGTTLWYGRTCMPYCNLRDEAGMAAPVFGPMALQ